MINWGEIKRQFTECEWPSLVIQNGLYALGYYLGVISALYGVYCLGLDGFQRLMRRFD